MSDTPTTPVDNPVPAAEPVAEQSPEPAPESTAAAPAPESAPAPALADLPPAACAARLAELFPAVFSPGAAQPLKLRIQADVQQRAPGVFTKKSLSIFLHRHTTSTAYLKALTVASARIDLDGAPAGEVADEHRQAALAELERRRALHDARRLAEREAQREAQRKAHDAQRQAHEAARREQAVDEDARRDRANLLRAYEATTLTRANFCALKGMPEAGLDALLAQARQEREQRAQAPAMERPAGRHDDRRGPRRDARPERGPEGRQDSRPEPRHDGRGPRPAHAGRPSGRPATAPKPQR